MTDIPLTFEAVVTPGKDPLTYLNPRAVVAVGYSDAGIPRSGRTVTGYGGRIPTGWTVRTRDGRTRRVYAMQYGNSASFYVRVNGRVAHTEGWTEGYMEDARDDYRRDRNHAWVN